MSKLKHEAELAKEAVRIGGIYAEKRGVGKFDPTDSFKNKVEFVYRLLVHDKLIVPLPNDQLSDANMRHRIALWIARQLPEGHPLLKN